MVVLLDLTESYKRAGKSAVAGMRDSRATARPEYKQVSRKFYSREPGGGFPAAGRASLGQVPA
jgi:hypothetical protein